MEVESCLRRREHRTHRQRRTVATRPGGRPSKTGASRRVSNEPPTRPAEGRVRQKERDFATDKVPPLRRSFAGHSRNLARTALTQAAARLRRLRSRTLRAHVLTTVPARCSVHGAGGVQTTVYRTHSTYYSDGG